MLIQMLADRFAAGGVLYAKGTQVNVADDLAFRWIGDGVATDVGGAREAQQGTQDLVSKDGKGKGIGTRVPFGRMGTISNAAATTYHVTAEAPCHFDAIRPLFASIDAARSYQHTSVKVSVLSDVSTDAAMLNNAGTWVTVTQNGQGAIPVATSVNGSRIAYTTPDFIPLASIDRTDGGKNPLVAIRSYVADGTAAALPAYGNGTDGFTNWATRTDGCMWAARQVAGDGVTTPTNFTGGTSATPQSQSPIIGFQYLARGRVITVCNPGDSISEGRGTYLGDGFGYQATRLAAALAGIATEFMQGGWSGQSCAGITGYAARALDILNTQQVLPDVMVMPIGSPNDETVTLTAAGVLAQRTAVELVISECKRKGVPLVLWTWLPTNYSVRPYGATDALRRAYNADMLARYPNVVDLAALFYGGVDVNGQDILINAADSIHPNDTGNSLAAALLAPAIAKAIFGA